MFPNWSPRYQKNRGNSLCLVRHVSSQSVVNYEVSRGGHPPPTRVWSPLQWLGCPQNLGHAPQEEETDTQSRNCRWQIMVIWWYVDEDSLLQHQQACILEMRQGQLRAEPNMWNHIGSSAPSSHDVAFIWDNSPPFVGTTVSSLKITNKYWIANQGALLSLSWAVLCYIGICYDLSLRAQGSHNSF